MNETPSANSRPPAAPSSTNEQTSSAARFGRVLARVQGWFYLVTGIWPWVSPATFQAVTGPKLDFWLAQTVGLLLAVSGFVFLLAARARRITAEIAWLAALQAGSLAAIDFYCVPQPRTTAAYYLDAPAEIALVVGWTIFWRRSQANRRASASR